MTKDRAAWVKLAALILFLFVSGCALSQQPVVIRLGIATATSSVEKVPAAEVQTQLLKLLNDIKPDKNRPVSIQTIALKESNRGEAIAEARTNACQFVLFAQIQEGVGRTRRFRDPAKIIQVAYEVARVDGGTDYAMGSAEAPLSGSPEAAAEKAEKRLVQEVTTDLCGKGSAPLAGVDPAQMNAAVPPSASPPPGSASTAPDFCAWMAGDIPQAQSLAGACEFALALPHRMPNFICEETTGRFRADSRRATDVITASLRYEDGKESFSDVNLNGKAVPSAVVDQMTGLWSTGEFGGNLRSIFEATNKPVFAFIGEKKFGTRPAWAFSYRIAEQIDPRWWLTSDDQRIAPPYSGELWLDQKTGELVMFRLTADGIPKKFPTQGAETLTAYSNVSFDDGTGFVLPVQSVVKTKYHGELTTNVLQFRHCHKFRAKSRMLLDVPEPKHP